MFLVFQKLLAASNILPSILWYFLHRLENSGELTSRHHLDAQDVWIGSIKNCPEVVKTEASEVVLMNCSDDQ